MKLSKFRREGWETIPVGEERVRVLCGRLIDAGEGYSDAEIAVALGLTRVFFEDQGFKWLDEAQLRKVLEGWKKVGHGTSSEV